MPGRHRRRRSFRTTSAIAVAMTLAVVLGAAWFGYRHLRAPGCRGQVRITVAAAPEIAPAVEAAATSGVPADASAGGTCLAVSVTAANPADVAAVVASQHGVSLPGIGEASGTAQLPDVWLVDSSTWLARLRVMASGFRPTNNASVARSPVVVAMPEPVAAALGWPERRLTWSDLVKQMNGTRMRVGTVEPTRDAAALSGLLALGAAAGGTGGSAQPATTALLRALATGKSALRQELLARFPRSTSPASIASGLSAAALSEEDVIAFNATKPPVELAALYLDPAPLSLDYPYAVMPGIDPAKIEAAEALFRRLRGTAFRDRLGALGLRAPDGTWGAGFAAPRGAPRTAIRPAAGRPGGTPDPALINRVLQTWTAVTLPARMLAVIDVSGSMYAAVPTAGNASRMQVTLQAAQRGLALFDDSSAIGLWTFSTELVGERDYRELVPIGPLSSQRSKVAKALRGIAPKPDGGTGLYDSLLAAYQAVQDDWEPGKVNSVVMFTDGKNDDANGVSHRGLLAELEQLVDKARPIQVIIIGIGTDISKPELAAITKITGGGVFVTEDPAKIGEIFLQAISLRPAAIK